MKAALVLVPFLAVTASWLVRAELQGRQRQVYILKPLSTLIVIAVALASLFESEMNPFYTAGVLGGLLFSFGGDVALMLRDQSQAFLVGLGLFLVAQILYTLVFFRLGVFSAWDALWGVLLLVIALSFFQKIQKNLGAMKIPVIGYILVITLMVSRALSTMASPNLSLSQAGMIAVGAWLFYFSDMILAANLFWKPLRNHSYSLLLYYAGQLLIALPASYFN
jgi:uncharacterized membrane protein YhhN